MTINIKADGVPDGAYGPFNLNCMLTVKDGVVVLVEAELPEPEIGIYRLGLMVGQDRTHASLTFEHAPAPEADAPKD